MLRKLGIQVSLKEFKKRLAEYLYGQQLGSASDRDSGTIDAEK
jgi:hypothetical protein